VVTGWGGKIKKGGGEDDIKSNITTTKRREYAHTSIPGALGRKKKKGGKKSRSPLLQKGEKSMRNPGAKKVYNPYPHAPCTRKKEGKVSLNQLSPIGGKKKGGLPSLFIPRPTNGGGRKKVPHFLHEEGKKKEDKQKENPEKVGSLSR